MSGTRRGGRVVVVSLLFGVLAVVGLAVLGGTAVAQSAPDCATVGYEQNGDGAYQVTNVSQLQCMGNDSTTTTSSDDFVLTTDVDASGTASWNGGDGFAPVGADAGGFAGTFDGNGHTISGLTADRGSERDVGLFATLTSEATVSDVTLENVDVTGEADVGALAGRNDGTVQGSSATGQVASDAASVGGLVGVNDGTVTEASAAVEVDGDYWTGGLVGTNRGTVRASSASGNVSGRQDVGGLVGNNDGTVSDSTASGRVTGTVGEIGGLVGDHDGDISASSATGDVTGQVDVGGLVGQSEGSVADSFARGNVTGDGSVGGLVGENDGTAVTDSYAVGRVDGDTEVGGLVGLNGAGATVETSYAACSVSGTSDVGGLVGADGGGSVTEAYWDVDTTNQTGSAGGTGLSSENMTGADAEATMTGFDFASTWTADGGTYPYLQANSQSPAPDPSCTFGAVEAAPREDDGDDSDDGDPTITNYRVTVEGDRLTVTFDSDDNPIEITVDIDGPTDGELDREDFSGNDFEGFRATYTVERDGVYTVELLSVRDAGWDNGADDREYSETVTVQTADNVTNGTETNGTATDDATNGSATEDAGTSDDTSPTPTATPTPEPTEAGEDAPVAEGTATPTEAEPTDTPTDGDGPGFGVWAALAALAAVATLLVRRRLPRS